MADGGTIWMVGSSLIERLRIYVFAQRNKHGSGRKTSRTPGRPERQDLLQEIKISDSTIVIESVERVA